ncbi:MAG: hypothetical protein Q8P93_00140 [bacterium]|nr:hypothetical protein [bacterium]
MRTYIDTGGRFKIDIPDHWICREEGRGSGNPVSFMFGDDSEDSFQISCIPRNKGRVPSILSGRRFPENKYWEFPITFLERNIGTDDMGVNIFEAKVEDHFILALHASSKKETDSNTTQEHLFQIGQSLETLLVVHPSNWIDVAAKGRFNRFMVSLLASIDLTNKGQEKGSSVELVILYANRIDALLRLALILRKQLHDSSNDIDSRLIFQDAGDQPIFEKAIYRRALDGGVIEESLFKRLRNLYELRNKVVHRYIISDLKTNDIIKLVVDYMDIHEIIGSKVGALEQEQFIKGIGIYGDGNNPKDPINTAQMKGLLTELHEKHSNTQIIKEMTIKISVDDTIFSNEY